MFVLETFVGWRKKPPGEEISTDRFQREYPDLTRGYFSKISW